MKKPGRGFHFFLTQLIRLKLITLVLLLPCSSDLTVAPISASQQAYEEWASREDPALEESSLLLPFGGGAAVAGFKLLAGLTIKNGFKAAVSINTSRQSFREAKRAAIIPTSAQFIKHKFVYDKFFENRTVYEFDINGVKKYIIKHLNDKGKDGRSPRGPHFHVADDLKGSPFEKGKYHQYNGHFPEIYSGYK